MSLFKGLPEALLYQYEYEDPIVRGGKHLMHSSFFQVKTTQNICVVAYKYIKL